MPYEFLPISEIVTSMHASETPPVLAAADLYTKAADEAEKLRREACAIVAADAVMIAGKLVEADFLPDYKFNTAQLPLKRVLKNYKLYHEKVWFAEPHEKFGFSSNTLLDTGNSYLRSGYALRRDGSLVLWSPGSGGVPEVRLWRVPQDQLVVPSTHHASTFRTPEEVIKRTDAVRMSLAGLLAVRNIA